MYHCNPARIKTILATMPDKDLARHVRYINKRMLELPEGNHQTMYTNLYRFAFNLARTRPKVIKLVLDRASTS